MNQARTTQEPDDNAARIRALRLSLGLSAKDVADAMGWHQPSRVFTYEGRHLSFSTTMEARIVEAIHRVAAQKALDRG